MPSKEKTRTTLSDAELADLFDLVQEADTMELKLTVPDSNFRSAALALGLDPLDAQIRMVYFFDTPDLKLFEKCVPGDAFQVIAQTRAFLSKADVDLVGEQAPKTRKALEFFSQQLSSGEEA